MAQGTRAQLAQALPEIINDIIDNPLKYRDENGVISQNKIRELVEIIIDAQGMTRSRSTAPNG